MFVGCVDIDAVNGKSGLLYVQRPRLTCTIDLVLKEAKQARKDSNRKG